MTIWNDQSFDFTDKCLPWPRQQSQQPDMVSGVSIEYQNESIQPTVASSFIYVVISWKYVTDHFEIPQTINRLMAQDRRAGAQVNAYSMKQ